MRVERFYFVRYAQTTWERIKIKIKDCSRFVYFLFNLASVRSYSAVYQFHGLSRRYTLRN